MPRSIRSAMLVCALPLLLMLTAPSPARADTGEPTRAEAAALYDQGRRAFDLADYATAIARWKASYLLSREPQLLFNLGQAYRLAGDCAQANRYYLTYERSAPRPSNAAELGAAKAKCAGVAPADGDPAPVASSITALATPISSPRSSTPTEGRPRLRTAGLISLGVGGVAGLVSVLYAVRAHDRATVVASQPMGTPWTPALADAQRAGHAAATRARAFGVVGAAAVVTGATLWWLGRGHPRVQIEVAITPDHGEASVSCAF